MRNIIYLVLCMNTAFAFGQDVNTPVPRVPVPRVPVPRVPVPGVPVPEIPAPEVDEVFLTGRLQGSQLALTVECEVVTRQANQSLVLVQGEAVWQPDEQDTGDDWMTYEAETHQYKVTWPKAGRHVLTRQFMVQSVTEAGSGQRKAAVQVVSARIRHIELALDRYDLDVVLPQALRIERTQDQGDPSQVTLHAILGPHEPLVVQWQPQVSLDHAKLVTSCQVNTIVSVRSGLLHLDTVFEYQVAQGRLESLLFTVPDGLRVTALTRESLRTWRLESGRLSIELSRPQDTIYQVRIQAEAGAEALPAEVNVPAITPVGGVRTSGYLAVGTSSALQLVVREAAGLTQIDGSEFPRVQADARPVPQGKVFFYAHGGPEYNLRLAVDDIVPSFDVSTRVVTTLKADDWIVEANLELDVRDAPLTSLEVRVPASLMVAAVQGTQVEDYHLAEMSVGATTRIVTVTFAQPVMGRVLVGLRLELGRGPLDQILILDALNVTGAKTQRGYVLVAVDEGIDLAEPAVTHLRQVHTASVPMRVAQAEFAYRFREADWQVTLSAQHKPVGLRVQVFHLQSIGEALAYGSAVVNCMITGSPMNEFRFDLPAGLDNIEFVGHDVRRFEKQDNLWVVTLARKVLGQYNLAVTYTQSYGPDKPIQIGTLQCMGTQSQTGTVVVTSFLDLRLTLGNEQGLMPVALDELPAHVRMLCHSPILTAYKYMGDTHRGSLDIDPYERSTLLPVVLDMASHQTELVVSPDQRIESVTKVRYKLKNTTGQFLSLDMPKEARVWTVSEIDDQGRATRLAVSHDQATGRLLVPLERQVNPNDPMTIELQYGRVHAKASGRSLILQAPASAVPMTYANWQVALPRDWVMQDIRGNMRVQGGRAEVPVSLARLCMRLIGIWGRGVEAAIHRSAAWVIVGVSAALAGLGLILGRAWGRRMVLVTVLGVLTWLGIEAAVKGQMAAPASVTTVNFVHALNADPNQALEIQATLVPAWRQNLKVIPLGLSALAVIAVGLIAFKVKAFRGAALALALTVCLWQAAKVPAAWPVLIHVLTWAGPVILCAYALVRGFLAGAGKAAATVLLVMFLSGCTGGVMHPSDVPTRTPIETLVMDVRAGDDMAVTVHMRVRTDGPLAVPLLDDKAVRIESSDWTVVVENGRQVLKLDTSGLHDVTLRFLAPLPPVDDNGVTAFEWPMPLALTNRFTLTVEDPNVVIEAPGAVAVTQPDSAQGVTLEALFAPGRAARFAWRPRQRSAAQEAVRFYTQDSAVAVVTSGLVRVHHRVTLQIAQGQVTALSLGTTPGHTVTTVTGESVGAWRFDPVVHQVDVRLLTPRTGQYSLDVVTQSANASVPYDIEWRPMVVRQAQTQHSFLALASDSTVQVRVDGLIPAMNTADFIRDNAALIRACPGLRPEQVTQAFRFGPGESVVSGHIFAVQSELRSQETARFNVEDERLVYNSQWNIDITKAGRFGFDMEIPEGFDIDTLTAESVSHWDESQDPGPRTVRVHFKRQVLGRVRMNLALSQPVAAIPAELTAPQVRVVGALKHTGQLVVGAVQGVRVSVSTRQGVSEINPRELGVETPDALGFQLLRPDWVLDLKTEQIQPRITVECLHHVKVTDGLVHHQHFLRYQLLHAGVKTFVLTLPAGAMGVTLLGPGMARREQVDPNTWRVELTQKVYDRPYQLTVAYDTSYDRDVAEVPVAPVLCQGVDLQQGYVVVFAGDRVELSADTQTPSWRPADPRSIPAVFGAGDLSNAAMCYRSLSATETFMIRTKRHAAADQIGAQVLGAKISSVLTETGQGIHQVELRLRVSTRRHLQVLLPDQSDVWSLAVDGQAVQPSVRMDAQSRRLWLVPLPQQGADEVTVSLVYVTDASNASWPGPHQVVGPRFDLPLENIQWQVYVPESYDYERFGGTLAFDAPHSPKDRVYQYSVDAYEQQVVRTEQDHEQLAQQQQTLARNLAQQGFQSAARRALSKGYNFSMGNRALNEDIRVDLDNLLKQQVKVGLVNAREALNAESSSMAGAQDGQDFFFSAKQAQNIEGTLGQADNDNLDLITQRIIQAQQAARGSAAQLQITMPTCGRLLSFASPLLVDPMADMILSFHVASGAGRRTDRSLVCALAICVSILLVGFGLTRLAAWCMEKQGETQGTQAVEPAPLDHTGQVSSEELI